MISWKRIKCVLALAAISISADVHAAGVAMVMDVVGVVRIQYKGRSTPAQIATTLEENAKVEVAPGGQVSLVHYKTRERLVLVGPAETLIAGDGFSRGGVGAAQATKLEENQARISTDYIGKVVAGAVRMRGIGSALEIKYPRKSESVLDLQRLFVIDANNAQGKFRVQLTPDGGNMLEQVVDGPLFPIGSFGNAKPGARHHMLVIDDLSSKKAEVQFTIMDPMRRASLLSLKPRNERDAEPWVFYAMALESESAITEANEAWSIVQKLRPDAAEAVKRLINR